MRKDVLGVVNNLGIPVIDIQENVFDSHHDPLDLFPFPKLSFRNYHYNAEGYRLVAEAITKRLKKDGIFEIDETKNQLSE